MANTPHILDLIRDKRDGRAHAPEQLRWLVSSLGDIPDYQLASWLMAVTCRGLDLDETAILTDAMAHSGTVLDLSDVPGPRVDKHSTGGVGDKVTLVFGPLLATQGLTVAKLSGRGLGHTGGTVDKLESIPGFHCDLPTPRFKQQLRDLGVVLGSQSAELAPADAILYALRDVTGTVESIPLIAASVLSKKIAAGADLILIDVKTGQGAFMQDETQAEQLARALIEVGDRLGKRVICAISEMGQPLGNAVGHASEVEEAIATLRGEGPRDLTDLCVQLGAILLVAAGKAESREAGEAALRLALEDGSALERFRQVIVSQGGDPRVIDDFERLPRAGASVLVPAPATGIVQALDARAIGIAAKVLGGGRERKGARIDWAVGVDLVAKVGDRLEAGEPLATLRVNDRGRLDEAIALVQSACTLGDEPASPPALIKSLLGAL